MQKFTLCEGYKIIGCNEVENRKKGAEEDSFAPFGTLFVVWFTAALDRNRVKLKSLIIVFNSCICLLELIAAIKMVFFQTLFLTLAAN
jgi:hypothetical protein